MNTRSLTAVGAMLAMLVLGAAGCTARFDTEISLDPLLKTQHGTYPSVEIHLRVAKTKGEYETLSNMSMTQYWKNPTPDEETLVVKLGAGKTKELIKRTDKMWDLWTRADRQPVLFVLSSYPVSDDVAGEADPRRLMLPLKSECWHEYWWGKEKLELLITTKPQGVRCLRQYKPWNPYEEK